jgi:hypothetical protein
LDRCAGAHAGAQNTGAILGTEIALAASVRVVGMGVGDDSSIYRTPRVNVKVPCFTVEAIGGNAEHVVRGPDFSIRIAEPYAFALRKLDLCT